MIQVIGNTLVGEEFPNTDVSYPFPWVLEIIFECQTLDKGHKMRKVVCEKEDARSSLRMPLSSIIRK